MRGNSWARYLGFTTFGESHGKAIGIVIEDVRPNIEFPFDEIRQELARRRPGKGKFSSSRDEKDELVVISGVFEGKTTGMPICLLVYNNDATPKDYEAIKDVFRPGHADNAWFKKFKIYDYRGGGRASGRETISRVIASGLVNHLIEPIQIICYPVRIGVIEAVEIDESFVKENELSWPCRSTYQQLDEYLERVKKEGDSVGGIVQVYIRNVRAGLGDPVFEKLDGNIAKALISIGGVKGIEFGDGFKLGGMLGSQANDEVLANGEKDRITKAGGIFGGVTSGDAISLRFVVKPTPSISIPQNTINKDNQPVKLELKGRFDTCLVQRIIPVVEAMIKLVLSDAVAYQKLIEGEEVGLDDLREAIDKIDEEILICIARRKRIVSKIGKIKKDLQLPIRQADRERELLDRLKKIGDELSLSEELIRSIWSSILEDSRKMQ